MKCTWEEKDIRPGLFILKQGATVEMHHSNVYLIGWSQGHGNLLQYGLISVFTDGMSHQIGSKHALMHYLNQSDRNYRPMTKKEVTTVASRYYEGLF